MRVQGQQLEQWAELLTAMHELGTNDIPGSFTYAADKGALVCQTSGFTPNAAGVKTALEQLGMELAVKSKVVGRRFHNTYTVTALDSDKLREPVNSVLSAQAETCLTQAGIQLSAAHDLLAMQVQQADFPPTVRKALERHRPSGSLIDDNGLSIDADNLMMDIKQLVQSSLPVSLPLYEILRLHAWETTGSKEADVYVKNFDAVKPLASQVVEAGRFMHTVNNHEAAPPKTIARAVEFASDFQQHVTQGMLEATAFFAGEAEMPAADGRTLTSELNGKPLRALAEVVKRLESASQLLWHPSVKASVTAAPLAALHQQALTGKAPAAPAAASQQDVQHNVDFELVKIAVKSGSPTNAIAAYVPKDQAPAIRDALLEQCAHRLEFLVVSSSKPDQAKIFLAEGQRAREFPVKAMAQHVLDSLPGYFSQIQRPSGDTPSPSGSGRY